MALRDGEWGFDDPPVDVPNVIGGADAGTAFDLNGAGFDPFAYTNGSLLTPWTGNFTYDAVPGGGYFQGTGDIPPLTYPDFNYGFSQPGGFNSPTPFVAPPHFTADRFNAPADFSSPVGAPSPFVRRPDFVPPKTTDDPGYRFRLQQGMDALQNAAAAKGILRTGTTWKGLEDYAQNTAASEYQAAFDRAMGGYTTNSALDLASWDRNAMQNDTAYSRAASEYDRSYQNALQRYGMGYQQSAGEYDRNFTNDFNTYQTNFGNQLGAYKTNADVSLAGQGLGYNIASGAWDRNYGKAQQAYQSAVQQAMANAEGSASASQWADSTNYGRALQAYNMGYETFNNNQANQFSRLMGIAGLGANATNTLVGAGQNLAGAGMGNITGAGNAGAAGTVGAGNAAQSGLGGYASLFNMLGTLGLFGSPLTTLKSGGVPATGDGRA